MCDELGAERISKSFALKVQGKNGNTITYLEAKKDDETDTHVEQLKDYQFDVALMFLETYSEEEFDRDSLGWPDREQK